MNANRATLTLCCLLIAPTFARNDTQVVRTPSALTQEWSWRMIGPFRGGRTRAVAGAPDNPHVFYIGAADGGVWRTDDAGRTWQPIFDAQPTQSIGALAVAPSDSSIIYVGTGEGLHRPDLSVGDGIYRSMDAGRTWTHLGLRDAQQVTELAVDPQDARRLFAAVLGHPYGPSAERGIFRSTDGGESWQRVLYKDADTGGSAVVIDPASPSIVYAALWQSRVGPWEDDNEYQGSGGGLYKSVDGGSTWRPLKSGLPENLAQISVAIAPSAPHRLYASVATTDPGDYSSAAGLGLYRSDDGGENWRRITSDPRPALRIGGGDLAIVRVDPSNPEVLYSTSIVTMKSSDGGVTWAPLRGAPGGDDYQNLWIHPRHPEVMALVSDQGAAITLNGGRTFSSWFNQPTAQLYHVIATPTVPYQVCAAQQESGSVCIASRGNDGAIGNRDWHPVGVIEYGYVAPDPLDADVIYGAGRNEVSKYHVSTGQVQNVTPLPLRGPGIRVDRTEPLLFAPGDPHTLFYGADRLYRTRDGGQSWQAVSPNLARKDPEIPPSVGTLHTSAAEKVRGVIYSIALSAVDRERWWAGTDDGLVWTTADGGAHWTAVTPPDLTPWSKIALVEASHFNPQTAYVAVNRMRVDDQRPYLYRTRDGGRSWQSIAVDLPLGPVNAVREDPHRDGLLFAATENALWVSRDAGDHWESLQLNLPHTSMRDVWIQGDDLLLATHGRSLWVLDDITRLRELPDTAVRAPLLLKPASVYRFRRSTWSDTPIPPDEPLAANPPDGAVIEYLLPDTPRGPIALEVLDAHGAVVRRFGSDDAPAPDADELARELIPPYWLAPTKVLSADPGMHRWVWDLRYAPPLSTTHGYPIAAAPHATPRTPEGPLATPGVYKVRLTVDGRHLEAPLTVRADPRVKLPQSAFDEACEFSRRLAGDLTRASRALLTARSEQAQLKALQSAGGLPHGADEMNARLAALLGPAAGDATPQGTAAAEPTSGATLLPAVQQHLETLYAELTRSDAPPTAAQRTATDSVEHDLAPLFIRWEQLQSELPAVNAVLRRAHLPVLRPELPPPRDANIADAE